MAVVMDFYDANNPFLVHPVVESYLFICANAMQFGEASGVSLIPFLSVD